MRNKVTNEIRNSKKAEIDILMENWKIIIMALKIGGKLFKSFIKPEQESRIPPLNKEAVIYSSDKDKANLLNEFFIEQTILGDSNASLPSSFYFK